MKKYYIYLFLVKRDKMYNILFRNLHQMFTVLSKRKKNFFIFFYISKNIVQSYFGKKSKKNFFMSIFKLIKKKS